jgi:Aspartate/tyrosine/aromatic aminotransferase
MLIYGGPESEIIYPDPGFPIYRSMIKFSGAKPVPLNLSEEDNFEINLNKLENIISDKTSLIIINNPNNPTGSFMNKNKIDKLVNILEKFPKIHILSDEIYSKIIFNKFKMPSFINYKSLRDRLVLLDGWSKTYCMTGWRLGWSVWPKKLIEYANKLCVNNHSCPSSISQYAGLEAIMGPQDDLNKIVFEFQKRKEFLHKEINKLDKINCFEPGGAFYAFPKYI